MLSLLFFLSSGLFLGWSLGANDAANVWGTSVGTRMVTFKQAALICSIFVILGAVISGGGANQTLGKLGVINSLGGAFTVALASALTVFWMTRSGLPVSTSQAIVGSIIGWNLFSGRNTDIATMYKILGAWLFSPILTAIFSFFLFFLVRWIIRKLKIHLIVQDRWTRILLIITGAFGSYSLGANNIANVMGVFTTSNPFPDLLLFGALRFSGVQLLFLLGGAAIALGVYTYSKRVMTTVGKEIYSLSPITALVVVFSGSLTLFLFASQGLRSLVLSTGLPWLPLVPVSSSQAIVGGVIGVGLARGGKNIRFAVIGRIVLAWVSTPVIAGALSVVSLFIMQKVFLQIVK
jgi:inorganic phosphate transporter, PiT family